jgi:tetratricopeptide (TPR) repeat protein
MGNSQIYIHSNMIFVRQDTLVAAFQIHEMNQALKEKGELRFTFLKNDEEFQTFTKKIPEFPDLPNILERFPLHEFPPDHYRIQISLMVDGREVLTEGEYFDVTFAEAVVRPWVFSKVLTGIDDPAYSFILGTQLFNSGETAKARDYLEDAYKKNPNSIEFALNLARIYLASEQYKEIEKILVPFTNQSEAPSYELLFILAKGYQKSGELDKAIDTFDTTITQYGLNTNVLNSLGECYFQLGVADEALAAWEKSLELNPKQPEIQKSVKALKEKK